MARFWLSASALAISTRSALERIARSSWRAALAIAYYLPATLHHLHKLDNYTLCTICTTMRICTITPFAQFAPIYVYLYCCTIGKALSRLAQFAKFTHFVDFSGQHSTQFLIIICTKKLLLMTTTGPLTIAPRDYCSWQPLDSWLLHQETSAPGVEQELPHDSSLDWSGCTILWCYEVATVGWCMMYVAYKSMLWQTDMCCTMCYYVLRLMVWYGSMLWQTDKCYTHSWKKVGT